MTRGWRAFGRVCRGGSVEIEIVELCYFERPDRRWILGLVN
jgi:hypothetical protein